MFPYFTVLIFQRDKGQDSEKEQDLETKALYSSLAFPVSDVEQIFMFSQNGTIYCFPSHLYNIYICRV